MKRGSSLNSEKLRFIAVGFLSTVLRVSREFSQRFKKIIPDANYTKDYF
jgi:hypothetical protein